eukprot:TRINITY_DN226_c0_g1_i2.p1 TRINITY_DN226_c0_g1~~TRINITY_DN226_c0_g1_i2.p1  ORF type:complete len:263 (+),score=51.82 TRINITY_DN226_c0_g1_i2:115-789(+)
MFITLLVVSTLLASSAFAQTPEAASENEDVVQEPSADPSITGSERFAKAVALAKFDETPKGCRGFWSGSHADVSKVEDASAWATTCSDFYHTCVQDALDDVSPPTGDADADAEREAKLTDDQSEEVMKARCKCLKPMLECLDLMECGKSNGAAKERVCDGITSACNRGMCAYYDLGCPEDSGCKWARFLKPVPMKRRRSTPPTAAKAALRPRWCRRSHWLSSLR